MKPGHTHSDVEIGSERSFGLWFAAAFGLFGLWPVVRGESPRVSAVAAAVVFLSVALARPRLLRPLNVIWFRFGMMISAGVTPVVMALLCLTAIVPTSLVLRMRGNDLLQLQLDPNLRTYWIERPPGSR